MKLNPKTAKAIKDYVIAVGASAATMGIALASSIAPQYAILIGAVTAPLAKWADKTSKDYGIGSKK